MFLGEYQHTLDAKGRVSLPRRFRDETGGHLVVSKGFEGCLFVHTEDGWSEFIGSLLTGNELMADQRGLRRFFLAGASEAPIDTAGRISLPQVLRSYAGLEKDVAVIGTGDRMEIWDAAKWAAYNERTAAGIEDAAEGLADKGIL